MLYGAIAVPAQPGVSAVDVGAYIWILTTASAADDERMIRGLAMGAMK